ncbi:hypothetical protein NQS36_16260 [Bacillus sp. C1(2022)]|uniref:hypothetical protein n=1 Tax=Bacillus TaxID=1386 RepID=UPI0018DA6A53|nr:hypothetical protein [Bacillus licheniformis]MEC1810928.1 hypothetical protein [Bacillus licheniformis]MED0839012.1 hypothetical protein [Bacillus licheniformis]MED0840837.1 hypothetical protein [Bacillus licheniformis]MED0848205.1 hypothetical protein [Bacillus licheniformis]MED0879495.1 hypothetical protein [Bacillus licheniformis]
MTINLKVIQEKPKGLSVDDIQDGFFLVKGDNAWVIRSHARDFSLIDLGTFEIHLMPKTDLEDFINSWIDIKILSPKQVNLNIGFQWRD